MSNRIRRNPDTLWGYLFISPQIIGFLIFVLIPLISIFVYSFQDFNILTNQRTFIGIENYRNMFTSDPLFLKTLKNSLIFITGLVPFNIIFALIFAVILTKPIRMRLFYRTIFFMPVITAAVAWAIIWKFLLAGDDGIINQILSLIGIHGPNWLREPGWAMFSVIFVRIIKNLGMNIVILMAAITNVPVQLSEAALIDGANKQQTFFHIIIPQLAPTLLMISVLTLIGALKVFDHILLLTAGGPGNSTMVLVYYIYFTAFQALEPGYASGGAVILFLLSLVFTIVQWKARKLVAYQEV